MTPTKLRLFDDGFGRVLYGHRPGFCLCFSHIRYLLIHQLVCVQAKLILISRLPSSSTLEQQLHQAEYSVPQIAAGVFHLGVDDLYGLSS